MSLLLALLGGAVNGNAPGAAASITFSGAAGVATGAGGASGSALSLVLSTAGGAANGGGSAAGSALGIGLSLAGGAATGDSAAFGMAGSIGLAMSPGAADGVRIGDAPGMGQTVFFSMVGGAGSNDIATGGSLAIYPAWRRTGRRGK